MEVIVRHFWLAFVVVTIVNGRYWWAGVQGRIRAQPELGPGYHRLYRGYLFWCNVPWLLMGVGILSGQVRWMFDFLQPRSGNAYVLAWWWTMATLLALGTVSEESSRSEEHTSELQSRFDLVCRLLLEKKKYIKYDQYSI